MIQHASAVARKARESHVGAVYSTLLVLLLLVLFLLPPEGKVYASIILTAIIVILIGLFGRKELGETRVSVPMLLCLFGLVVSVLLTLSLSPYSKRDLLIDTSFLVLSVLLFYCMRPLSFDISPVVKRVFYYVALSVVVLSCISHGSSESPYYVFGSYDKNYFGVVLFLFFCWCWCEKRKLGVVVCVVAAFMLNSRGYQMMILCFVLINGVMRLEARRKGSNAFPRGALHPVVLFVLFGIMLFSIVAFSWWWSTAVVGGETVSASLASRGLNDTSNAIRFNSNLYAMEQIGKDPLLFVRGYDTDIQRAMNIGSPFGDKDALLASASMNGYRIVQPHHAVLNLLLKHGVLFTVFYLAVLCIAIAPYVKRETACIWIPFFLIGMVMHSTLTSHYLLFFVFVLAVSAKAKRLDDVRADAVCRSSESKINSSKSGFAKRQIVFRKGVFI